VCVPARKIEGRTYKCRRRRGSVRIFYSVARTFWFFSVTSLSIRETCDTCLIGTRRRCVSRRRLSRNWIGRTSDESNDDGGQERPAGGTRRAGVYKLIKIRVKGCGTSALRISGDKSKIRRRILRTPRWPFRGEGNTQHSVARL